MASIAAKDIAGKPFFVQYSRAAPGRVLYIFAPDCGWCARNLRNLKTLAGQILGRHSIVAISLTREGLADYVASNRLPIDVAVDIPPSTVREYRFGGTPQTIVVSPAGVVLKSWSGAFGGRIKSEVED